MSRTRGWTPLALVYLGLSIAGIAITWTFNGLAIAQGSEWFGEWFSNGAATQSLQWDLVVLATAASVFVIVESRRIGMTGLGTRAPVVPDGGGVHGAAVPGAS